MIQKEQFKELQEELEEKLKILKVPRYVWYWPELLINTLLLMSLVFFPEKSLRKKQADRALKLTREIYG